MLMRPKPTSTRTVLHSLLLAIGCLTVAACGQKPSTDSATPQQNDALLEQARAKLQASKKTEAALAAMTHDALRKLASTALREQRLYAPAGNNALEYYLAIRKKSDKPDVLTESALMDLTPYTVIAAEQAIANLDFNEATRLRDLIAGVDASAPALPRISGAISDGMKNAEALAETEINRQEALLAAEQAAPKAKQDSLSPAASTQLVTKSAPLPITASTSMPTPMPAIALPQQTPLPAAPPRVIVASVVPAKKAELISLRTPDPSFPSDAMNRGLSGAVEIEFIVQRNGEVSEVRVVNSSQRAFDRNVVNTVKRWKFAPIGEPMTVRRSFNFTNPG